jgi:hypothetical protein
LFPLGEKYPSPPHLSILEFCLVKGIGFILFFKKWLENNVQKKTIKIISEVIMGYVQL